ncbi:MAG TPA: NERD domain-containing protein [Actinomycetota bacterium]|nr:NERD domain-containing protein [Actinomycetota bacterium]
MRTAGRYARTRIRNRRRAFLRRHWWRLAAAALTMLVFVGAVARWALDLDAATAAAVAWLVVGTAFAVGGDKLDGTYLLVSARDAERWTSRELRRALGRDWRVIDWISFEHYDVDHVVVGPGGVYVVETKYTDSPVELDTWWGAACIERWDAQLARATRSVRLLLGAHDVAIGSVLVVWGAGVEIGESVVGSGIVGEPSLRRHAARWRSAPPSLSDADVGAIAQRLRDYRKMRARYERRRARRNDAPSAGYARLRTFQISSQGHLRAHSRVTNG